MRTIKKILIYGRITNTVHHDLEEIQKNIDVKYQNKMEAVIDYDGSYEGLYSLAEKIKNVDIIIIYDKGKLDDFAYKFIYTLAKAENVEVEIYKTEKI